ncbi:MAG: putative DNA binding domain-containing protein [Thermoguttaceae bacterium]|jgi:ATP-dependent DNA helicase RecG|nr:putative DNA binding domain-containing protein [Thermoguttaceae bacterium]
MEAIEVIELIAMGEDSRTQFKENIHNAESLAGDLAAFANSRGGRILVGVDDQGNITGLTQDDVRRLNQLIANTATNNVRPAINPETENLTVGDELVMVVSVREGVSKPYSDNAGVFWVKCGSDKRRVTSREEIQRLLQSVGLVHADEIPVEGTTLNDLDDDHLGKFFEVQYGTTVEESLKQSGLSMAQLLNNLGLARNETLNLAGLLVFGKSPQRHRPAFVVKAVSFVGDDPAGQRYRDSEDIDGCLRDLHARTMSFLTRNLRCVQGEKGFNTEGDLEIPAVALEELVVNMLLHCDYFISAPWRVMIFDNRVELISPGALPNNLTVENIRNGVSNIRNPFLASFATKELPYRGIGTGIRRALAAVPELELESDHNMNQFTARIPRAVGAETGA